MPKFEIHLAVADRIYFILGKNIIKNTHLFFSGSLAPDAFTVKADYQVSDKNHTHMCEGETVHSYGYGYPEFAELFKNRINKFIERYYLRADEDRDLYLGYIIHLFTDEIHRTTVYMHLEEYLKTTGGNTDEPDFRKSLADRVAEGEYKDIFNKISRIYSISINEYPFTQNLVNVLNSPCEYEVKDYISTTEINTFNQLVINSIQNEQNQNKIIDTDNDRAIKFIELAAEEIISRLSGKEDIIKIL